MADPPQLPTRFVSQSEIESTNAKKEEAWKAAYARIGQEPPVREVDEKYDGRSLAEKLAANRAAKQEEFENSHKLSAQFRSLDPDEITFLDEVAVRRMEEDKRRREGDEEALRGFRACVFSLPSPPLPLSIHLIPRCSSLLGRSNPTNALYSTIENTWTKNSTATYGRLPRYSAVQARDTAPPIPGPSTSPTLSKSHSDTLPTAESGSGSGSGASAGSTSAAKPTETKPTSPTVTKTTSKHPQSPTSKKPQASAPAPPPPPTKTRSIKAGLKGVVVQRKRSKAGGARVVEGSVGVGGAGVARGVVVDVESAVGGTSKLGHGTGDEEAEEGDRKRRRVE